MCVCVCVCVLCVVCVCVCACACVCECVCVCAVCVRVRVCVYTRVLACVHEDEYMCVQLIQNHHRGHFVGGGTTSCDLHPKHICS